MVLNSKKKKTISIALVIIFSLMILSGIGLGLYFFIAGKDESGGLSKNQIAFGTAIKNYKTSPSQTLKNFDEVYSGDVQNILCYSDEFLAYESDSKIHFVSMTLNQSFLLDFNFDTVVCISGKFAHLKNNLTNYFVNLETKTIVANFEMAVVEYYGDYVLIKGNGSSLIDINQQESVYALVLNTKTGEMKKTVAQNDNVIDISLTENFAIVYELTKTTVYSLNNNFEVVLQLDNIGSVSDSACNLQSSISSKQFVMIEYYRAKEISKNLLLLEKTSVTTDDSYTITFDFDGRPTNYKVEYNIYDTQSKAYGFIQSDGFLIDSAVCDFGDWYVALVKTKILNKQTISSQRYIEYYYVSSNISGNSLQVEKLVSYDYDKYGLVVGFENGKLLTKGGTASGVITFDGNSTDVVALQNGEKAESNSWDSSFFVYSSISGLKGVKNSNGEVVFDAIYDKISPISNGHMVAKLSNDYYILGEDLSVSKIDNFAEEFEKYVFSGIGFYFVKDAFSAYDVYKFDKTVYKSSQKVKFFEGNNVLLAYIGNEILEFSLPNGLENANMEIGAIDVSFALSLRNFVGASTAVAQSNSLTFSNTYCDSVTGAGTAIYNKTFNASALEGLSFSAYSELSSAEKALVPTFDNADNAYVSTSDDSVYLFDGAYVEANSTLAVAIIRLKNQATNAYSYLVNVALKNAYLGIAQLTDSNSNSFVWFNEDGKQTSLQTTKFMPAVSLSAKVGLYGESQEKTARTVNYASAGYDGGVVFASDETGSISISLTISNVYLETSSTSLYSFDSAPSTIDFGSYYLEVINSNGSKKIQLVAKNGYAFKGATFISSTSNSIVGADKTTVSTTSEYARTYTVDYSSSSGAYFGVENISIIELYSRLTLKDYTGSERSDETKYYFYGYADNVSATRNPAPFGFSGFNRVSSVGALSRTGYEFSGYTFEDTDTVVIDKNGSFVGDVSLFVSNSGTIAEFNLKAKYTPIKYNIQYKNGGTILAGKNLEVEFDSEIGKLGSLLTEAEIEVPFGYNFKGWTYNGNLISNQTIYDYPSDIVVESEYEAKTYTLTFDTNTSIYKNVTIKGYSANISSVVYTNDYSGNVRGDSVSGETITKQITFAEPIGFISDGRDLEIPEIQGLGENGEEYLLIGWFDQKTFTISGETISSGTAYTKDSVVDQAFIESHETLTLYAHYSRKVYKVALVDNGSDTIYTTEGLVAHMQNLAYDGSTQLGTKTSCSTSGNTLVAGADGAYPLYTVSGESIKLTANLGDGYYVSRIVITVYNGASEQTYTIVGSMSGSQYSLVGSMENLSIDLATKSKIIMTISNVNSGKEVNGENLFATVEVESTATYLKNTFVLSDDNLEVSRGESFNTSTSLIDENLIYCSTNLYTITQSSKTTDSIDFDLVRLQRIRINQQFVDFTMEYGEYAGQYFSILKPSGLSVEAFENKAGVLKFVYALDNCKIIIEYTISTTKYNISLEVYQSKDTEITLSSQSISSSVKLNLTNTSTDASKTSGITATITSATGSESIATEYSKSGVAPADKFVFKIKLNSERFLMSEYGVFLKYAGETHNIMSFATNVYGQSISQSLSVIAPEMFTTGTISASLNGTYVSISYNSASSEFTITVLGVYADIEFTLQYSEFKLLTIESLSNSFETKVLSSQAELENLVQSNPSDFKKYTQDNYTSYLILKNESTTSQIAISAISNEKAYQTISEASENCTLNASNSTATANFSENNKAYVKIESKSRSFYMKSYLGQGVGASGEYQYSPDPIGSTPQTQMSAESYYNSDQLITSHYESIYTSLSFTGTTLNIKFTTIQNYTLYDYGLFDSNKQKVSPVTETTSGDQKTLNYVLDSDAGDTFEFIVYFRPYLFNITYDLEGNLKNKASSELVISDADRAKFENQVAYWGVAYQIPNVDLQREGYTFQGYSKTLGGEKEYSKNQSVTNFGVLDAEASETMSISLFAVYSANEYSVKFVKRDAESANYKLGSTNASLDGDYSDSVLFDQAFKLPQASRVGYDFKGWYTSISGTETENKVEGIKVDSSAILNKTLFDQLTRSKKGEILLYADWDVKTITVNFDENLDCGDEKTDVTMSFASVSVKFDTGIVTLPTASRDGYIFKGFSSQKYNATTIVPNVITENKVLDKSYVEDYNISISSGNEFTLYAVWEVMVYKANIQTAKDELRGDEESVFNITGYTGEISGTYYITISFGATFPVVPEIEVTGYTYKGVFTAKDGGEQITTQTKLTMDFLEKVENNNGEFPIYARYEINKYNVTVQKGDLESCSKEGTNVVEFFDSIEIAMKTQTGYYVNEIQIISTKETITITFEWDAYEQKVKIQSVQSTYNASLSSIEDSSSMCKKIQIEHGFNADTSYWMNFEIQNVKSDMTVKVTKVKSQEFIIAYYTYAVGTNGQSSYIVKYREEKYDILGGQVGICQDWVLENVDYPYLPGYQFEGFYFADLKNGAPDAESFTTIPKTTAEQVLVGGNKYIVAKYTDSTRQGVNFYFYDANEGKYVKSTGDTFMMYWKDGSTWKSNTDKFDITPFTAGNEVNILAGKIKELPSVGIGQWPTGYVPCGFIINDTGKSSGYYTLSSITDSNRFTSSTKIESELNVYVVYDEQKFELTASGVSHNIHVEYNGTYQKYDGTVEYYKFKDGNQVDNFNNYIKGGDTAEVALAKIVVAGGASKVAELSGSGSYIAVILGVGTGAVSDTFYKVSNILTK